MVLVLFFCRNRSSQQRMLVVSELQRIRRVYRFWRGGRFVSFYIFVINREVQYWWFFLKCSVNLFLVWFYVWWSRFWRSGGLRYCVFSRWVGRYSQQFCYKFGDFVCLCGLGVCAGFVVVLQRIYGYVWFLEQSGVFDDGCCYSCKDVVLLVIGVGRVVEVRARFQFWLGR